MTLTTPSRNRAETRERLLQAGFSVFSEHGIARASINEICDRAGFTRGAFYSNFTSREELFLALFEDEMASRVARLKLGFKAVTESVTPSNVSAAWMIELVLSAMDAERERDEQWFTLASEAQVIGLRNRELGRELFAVQRRFTDSLAQVIADELELHQLALNMPITDAVDIVIALYEAALKRSMLTGSFEEARRTTLALIPCTLDPLIRVRADSALAGRGPQP